MNGNKPALLFASDFSERVARHARVAYYPSPDASPNCRALVKMVIDEILVAKGLPKTVKTALNSLGAVYTNQDVFHHPLPIGDNVEIWRLKPKFKSGSRPWPDVADVVWQIRAAFPHVQGQVAPNHVLIPAPYYHDCPHGPPRPWDDPVSPLQAEAKPTVNVTVIDAGYQDIGPVAARVGGRTVNGEWFRTKRGQGEWFPEDPTINDADRDNRLDGLVGHANFVAGILAQESGHAHIDVVSHNAAFVKWADRNSPNTPIPTEASVARSLWKSANSDIINVGFAFSTLPYVPPTADDLRRSFGPESWTLSVVLASLNPNNLVVAPAGNQSCPTPQYPAAFQSVAGIGSSNNFGQVSDFSNYGPWVKAYAPGEGVISTFINDWPKLRSKQGGTEEAEPDGSRPNKKFTSGWAVWDGSSFAAPKIAGVIANLLQQPNVTPREAWTNWKAFYDGTPYVIAVNTRVRRP